MFGDIIKSADSQMPEMQVPAKYQPFFQRLATRLLERGITPTRITPFEGAFQVALQEAGNPIGALRVDLLGAKPQFQVIGLELPEAAIRAKLGM